MGEERRIPIWVAVLFCLGVLALITLAVDGAAIGAFARWIQYALAIVAVLALVAGAIVWWLDRRQASR
jgi:uncharacterized membrane protein SpoIIM required for sporulation